MVAKLPTGSFFGRTITTRSFQEITLQESAYADGLSLPPHTHSEAFFDLVIAGDCTECVDTRTRARGPSTLAFHPAGEVHSSRWHGPQARCFHIELSRPLLHRALQYSPGLDHPLYYHAGPAHWLARR